MPQYKHSLIYLKPNYRLQESCLTLVSHSSLSQEFACSPIRSFVPLYSSAFLVFARLTQTWYKCNLYRLLHLNLQNELDLQNFEAHELLMEK